MNKRGLGCVVAALALLPVAGCSSDDAVWDRGATLYTSLSLADAAVLVDPLAERALVLQVEGDLALRPTSLPIGRAIAASAVTTDAARGLILTRGDVPRRTPEDQGPALTMIEAGEAPAATRFELTDPLSGLFVDPLGEYAIVAASATDAAFVTNPNELVVVDLAEAPGASNPTPVTLRSFGGVPQRLTFTPELDLPGGSTRLLVVETDRDVGLLDLNDLGAGDVTVRLSAPSTGEVRAPAQVVVTDGEAGRDDDARIAVRVADQPSVVFVDLLPSSGGARAFAPTPNEVFVGGVPTDVAFVRTDGGARLAATLPSEQKLALADPMTGIATYVDLGDAFDHISLVTDAVGDDDGSDVALLWSTSAPKIAFVSLGGAVGEPYRAVEEVTLDAPVRQLFDVPPPNAHMKVLMLGYGASFAVLDLRARTQAPIRAAYDSSVTISPSGARAWLVANGGNDVADLDLGNLHPRNLELDGAISGVLDVRRRDGGRALCAVRDVGAVGMTVLDGEDPSLATAVEYAGLLLGELP